MNLNYCAYQYHSPRKIFPCEILSKKILLVTDVWSFAWCGQFEKTITSKLAGTTMCKSLLGRGWARQRARVVLEFRTVYSALLHEDKQSVLFRRRRKCVHDLKWHHGPEKKVGGSHFIISQIVQYPQSNIDRAIWFNISHSCCHGLTNQNQVCLKINSFEHWRLPDLIAVIQTHVMTI